MHSNSPIPFPVAPASPQIEDAAASWVERRAAGLTASEVLEYNQWLQTDPGHAAAVGRFESVWKLANGPRVQGEADAFMREVEARAARKRRTTYRRMAVASLGFAAAVAIGFFLFPRENQSALESASAVVLRPDVRILEDGSRIELNAGAEITVDYSPEVRGVRLIRGEALFSVAKNPNRPFIVTAGGVNFRAVGTAFSVRLNPEDVRLLVTEGKVQVNHPAAKPAIGAAPETDPAALEPVYVNAGGSVVVPLASSLQLEVVSITPAEMETALAWRNRRIEFTLTPLAEAAELFNRDNETKLVLEDADVANMRITGVFWTDDPEGFSRLLTASLGIRAQEEERKILLRR